MVFPDRTTERYLFLFCCNAPINREITFSIVARTQAVNRCREISKRNTISLENTDFIDQLGVVDNILEAETRKSLIAAVNALGEPDREILIRRYYYDQKPKEIALAMDMSVKQVDNRLYQTKLKLRESLSN